MNIVGMFCCGFLRECGLLYTVLHAENLLISRNKVYQLETSFYT
jgi:hypothetical protein